MEKPREITVKATDVGSGESKAPGLRARDTQTDAVLVVPLPVWRNGNTVEGREAAQHIASLLLMAQGRGGLRPSWDRDLSEGYVFTVWSG
jgi:hypothetical protein